MSESGIIDYAVLIPLLPMLAFPVILFLGKIFNGTPAWVKNAKEGGIIALTVMGASLLLALLVIKEHMHHVGTANIFTWFESSWWNPETGAITTKVFGVGVHIDHLTVMLLFVAAFLCFLINIFSIGYMNTDSINDNRNHRFYAEFVLFCSGMLGMVLADSFLWLFIFWELMGLCSYLLIGFYWERPSAAYAAKKAFLTTRVGDVFLVIGLVMLWNLFDGHLDYAYVFNDANIAAVDPGKLQIALGMMFIGAVGKSAQFPLHVWLPDAMEGPTPVSALIHAATLVTAGVFLMARSSPLLEYANGALSIITIFGGMTAFFAATTGLLQNDLKRVIAYSTCSQLGYMVFACGVSNYAVGVFHLANHAFFKALLFLSAGSVIHGVSDEQDMRKMGGLRRLLPFTYAMMLIGSLSLMGMPFLTGFYSKDVILEVAYAKYTIPGHFAYWLGTFAAFFTAFYSMRLAFLTFLSEPNGYRPVITNAHDSPIRMALPLAILAVPSIFIGFIARDAIIGLGSDFWSNAIFVHPKNLNSIDAEFIPHSMKLLPVGLSITGAASACVLYSYKSHSLYDLKMSEYGKKLYTFLNRKWFFDKVYNEHIAQKMLFFGYHISYKTIDRGIIEIFGPMGLSTAVTKQANLMRELQTGYIYHYAFFIFLGTGVLIGLSFLDNSLLSLIDYRIICLLVATAFASKQIKISS